MCESFREVFVASSLPELAYNASGCCVCHDEPLYSVLQVRRRPRGGERGNLSVKTTLVLKGALRKRMRRSALNNLEEIKTAFARIGASRN